MATAATDVKTSARKSANRKASAPRAASPYAKRAHYEIPTNIFSKKRAPVPCHVFVAERDKALNPRTKTGLIVLDQSKAMGFDQPASTPFVLARYARIRAGESLTTSFQASGEIYYVVRGSGVSQRGADRIAWREGDVFALPGGGATIHSAEAEHAVLYIATDEPLLAFMGVAPAPKAKAPIQPVHYPAEEIERHLNEIIALGDIDDAAGKAVQFLSERTAKIGTVLPTLALAVNSLPPKQFQRAHRHNAVALTLCIQGEKCYSMIDGQRVDWQRHAVMITPPTAIHSHHNDGDVLMKCLIVQDGGVYYRARTVGFSFE
ncbi:MAG: cupin domain-containing protein [Gammaproteobacteria bacterium]